MASVRFWLWQVALAIDQLCNAMAGGWADETWSSRCWREGREGWIAFLDWFDKDHCFEAYMSERLRLQAPPETR